VIEGGNMPPEVRDMMGRYTGAYKLTAGFLSMLVAGAIFSTLGGLLGTAIFKKSSPPAAPGTIDVPSQP